MYARDCGSMCFAMAVAAYRIEPFSKSFSLAANETVE